MDLGFMNVTGTVTENANDTAHWINGRTFTHPVGSVSNLVFGGQTGAIGYLQGDRCCVAYIKSPGAGSFDLQYESSLNVGTWVTLATISTENAGGTIGAYAEYSLPTSNWPFLRLRITNVTSKSLIRIGAGIYNSDGGGGIAIMLGSRNSFSPEFNVTSSAIFDPIWQGLAPDMVLSCFREDDHTQWEAGGAFDNFYLQTKALKSETDWLLIGMHPSLDETYYPAITAAQKAWAVSRKESWFNPYNIFRDYATANAQGLMADVMHLNSAGETMRHNAIWQDQILGRMPLGGFVGGTNAGSPLLAITGRPGTLDTQPLVIPSSLVIRPTPGASYGELEIWDINSPNDMRMAVSQRNVSGSLLYRIFNVDVFEINQNYAKMPGGFVQVPTAFAASASLRRWHNTAVVNASSAAVTMTIFDTSASLDGRIYTIKKIDSSANTVTIDPSGSETIDGAATLVLANQWDYVRIQAHAGNWIIVGGNI
jgi:hypothetical protein